MLYTIQNEYLTATVSELGAELISVKDQNGEEWMWEGDPTYWDGHSPVLFPYCGRFWQGLATVNGVPCDPGMHGFFRFLTLKGEQNDEKSVSFTLSSSAETLGKYPFPFEMKMIYTLDGKTLSVSAEVTNTGDRTMPYGYGVHPGFRLPVEGGKYHLRFPDGHGTRAMCLDASECYPVGGNKEFPLRDGVIFDLPDGELSAVLCEIPSSVTVENEVGDRRIVMDWGADLPYLTLWSPAGGPFVCVEPWTSIPSYYGQETELTEKQDLVHLPAGETRVHTFRMQFGA